MMRAASSARGWIISEGLPPVPLLGLEDLPVKTNIENSSVSEAFLSLSLVKLDFKSQFDKLLACKIFNQ